MRSILCLLGMSAVVLADAEWLVIGNDTKIECRQSGLTKVKPGIDTVSFLNLATGKDRPELVSLPLSNSIFGPPTNIVVTPDQELAIVANSVDWVEEDGAWGAQPASELHLIALDSGKPVLIGQVATGPQPSGLSISRDGERLLVANRAGKSVSLFSRKGKELKMIDTIGIEGEAAAVSFLPDGKRALVTKFSEHRVAVIDIEGDKLRYDPAMDVPVGLSPYNLKVAPSGRMAIVCNTGNNGLPDGHRDSLSVIDLTGEVPHVCDTVSVGDGPEGLAISADGRYLAVPLLNGSTDIFLGKWFHHPHGEVVLFRIEGLSLREVSRAKTGAFPEGIAFNSAGDRLYVANLDSEDLTVFAVEDDSLKQLGEVIELPGKPGSMGGGGF